MMKNVLLFGVSCVGKTTVGKGLSQALGWRFFDVDDDIIRQCQCTIQEFVDSYSCPARNEVRRKIILKRLAEPYNTIIAVSSMHHRSYIEDIILRDDVLAIHLVDSPQNIFNRLVFTDDNDQLIEDSESYKLKHKRHYLKEIREDIEFFSAIYSVIPTVYNVNGKTPDRVVAELVTIVSAKQ